MERKLAYRAPTAPGCHCYRSHWVSVDSPPPEPMSHEAGSHHGRIVSLVKLNTEPFGNRHSPCVSVLPLPRDRDGKRNRQCPRLHRGPTRLLGSADLLIFSMLGPCRCESCGAVFHSECKEKSVPCPRCVRRELQKKQKSFWRQLNVDESLEEACTMFELSYQNT